MTDVYAIDQSIGHANARASYDAHVIFIVHTSDMLPRRVSGPLQEHTRQVINAEGVREWQGVLNVLRAGLSGKRWHAWGTSFSWWIDRGEKKWQTPWNHAHG